MRPKAIGTYSQAVRVGKTVYVSGQIPLDPRTGAAGERRHRGGDPRVLRQPAGDREPRGRHLLAGAVKVTVFLTDLAHFAKVNEIMATYFRQPYPARAAVGVAQLPQGARVEIECILPLP